MNEAALHELLSGRRQGVGAVLVRSGLSFAARGYGSAIALRNFGYDRQWLPVHRADVPVISLGNLTTGGTGKTPLAGWLANWLIAEGHRPGLLSRGYHALTPKSGSTELSPVADSAAGNDEKRVLDRLCPGVPHLQQRDRVASARQIVSEFGCDVLLLDDGFQHRRLHRDLDLVLIDALQPWGYGRLLPRGLLREPLSSLRRADLILITRADQCSPDQRQAIRQQLKRVRGTDECVEVAFAPRQLVDPIWNPHPLETLVGKRAFAFCGIGNPRGFRQTMMSLRVVSEQVHAFPDHHHYDERDLTNLAQMANKFCADIVCTTQKDLVKIAPDDWHGPPLFAIEIGADFVSGKSLLEASLRQTLKL